MSIKKIIIGGCSFSAVSPSVRVGKIDPDDQQDSWAYRMYEKFPDIPIRFASEIGIGQELIQKRLSAAIIEELKSYKGEEIAVIVMWSGTERKAFYVDNRDYIKDMINEMLEATNITGLRQFDNLWPPRPHNQATQLRTKEGFPFEYFEAGGWYHANYTLLDTELIRQYINTMTTRLAQVTISLENMIFLQNLCKIHNIKLFQSYYRSHVYQDILDYKDHLNNKYLYDQLDHNTIVSTTGIFEYLRPEPAPYKFSNRPGEIFDYVMKKFIPDENDKYFGSDKFHPNKLGSEKWTDEVLFPKLATIGL